MGFIDVASISEDDLCDVKYKLKNILVKPNATEEHSISVDIEYDIFCRVFGDKEVSLIQDMYSPSKNLSFNQNKVITMVNMKNMKSALNIREKIRLEDEEYSKICSASANAIITEKDVSKDMVKYSGDIKIKFILTNNEENFVKTQEVSFPFSFNQEIAGVTQDSKIDVEISNRFEEFTKDNMEVSVKLDLDVNTNSYDLESINLINNVEEQEESENNPYSMVIYFVKPGDSLWQIAKKYKSTVEDIARINNIEDTSKINIGMQLFIPKSVISKLNSKTYA